MANAHEIIRQFIHLPINENDSDEFNYRSTQRALLDEYDDLRSIFKKCVDIIAFDDREADIKIERIREVMLTSNHLEGANGAS